MNSVENKNKLAINTEFDVDILKSVFKRNWFVIPLILFIGVFTAYLYLRYTKPVYQSQAVIQRTSKDEGKRILEIDNFEQESKLSEDVELLNSTFLLEKAIKKLNLKISYFSKGQILTEENYLQSPYHMTLMELNDSSLINKPLYLLKDDSQYWIKLNEETKVQVIPDSIISNEYFKLAFKVNDVERLNSSLDENELFFKFNDSKLLTQALQKDLAVYIVNPDAKTIQISFQSNNRSLAQDVVSSLISAFFEYDLEQKSQSSANILNFINNQLDTVYNQLKLSENDILSFKDSNNSTDPEFYREKILAQLDLLQSQAIDADLEYDLIMDIDHGINSKDRMSVYNVILAITGTRFQGILENQLNKLHELLEAKEDASYNLTEENDAIKILNIKIETQVETTNRTLNSIKNQIKNNRDGVHKKIADLESKLYGVPEKEMEYSRLKRRFNLNEKYYSLLIEKRTQYEISKAGFTIDNLILQEPSTAILISPKRKLIYIGTVVVSLLITFLFLVVKYITFNEINSESELKKLVPDNVGFLGVIPKENQMNADNSMLVVHKRPKSMLTEAYRNVRTNLQFVLKPYNPNVIAVSSSISGEGKTFIALNLAGIFNMSGKKVLVLDLDLRKPKVHLGFNAPNKEGMSSILADKLNWKEAIQKTELEDLDFISAGTIPPNPSELIISPLMDKVIDEMKDHYDLIIIDNPPVGIVSDGIKILNQADCAIYVFRANYSKRLFANRLRELLSEKKVQNLFMLLNGANMKRSTYSYGYGYGGYYEDTPNEKKWWQIFKK